MWSNIVRNLRKASYSTAVSFGRVEYSRLEDVHLQAFESILDKNRVLTDPADLVGYNTDWLKQRVGQSRVVLRPKTAEEVSGLMKYCSSNGLAVCPQGGNTGLVGGSVPVFDEVIISTCLMNNILDVDPLAGTVSCEAGCVLEAVNTRLEEDGLMMPYDLGSKGSCQIGGNISTSAGGLRLIRYGSMQANLLGIQAVLANGEILDSMNPHRKDNTGYHLRQLFVGAEGTLGIVTAAIINCPVKPKSVSLAFLGLKDYKGVLATLFKAKRSLCETLSSCELMDSFSMESVVTGLGLRCPFEDWRNMDFFMLIETQGSNPDHDLEKVNRFLEDLMRDGVVQDGIVTSEPSKISELWKLRERIIMGLAKMGYVYTYDLTFKHEICYDVVKALESHLSRSDRQVAESIKSGRTNVSCCGHIGDGNIHLDITTEAADPKIESLIEPFIYEWTISKGGSISAEHGIGLNKRAYLPLAKSKTAVDLMLRVKKTLDPQRILNPYKVLPE